MPFFHRHSIPLRTPRFFLFLLSAWFFPPALFPALSGSELFDQAFEAFLNEQYDQAAGLFRQVLDVDKTNQTAEVGLRNALKRSRVQEEKKKSEDRPALEAAEFHRRRKEWVQSLDRLRGVLRRSPSHSRAQSLLGSIRSKIKAQFEKTKPETSEWFFLKGVAAYAEEDYATAQKTWEQVYAYNPDMLFLSDAIDRAKRHVVEQRHAQNTALYQNLAWDNLNKGQYEESMRAWSELLKLEPGNALAQAGLEQAREAAALKKRSVPEEDTQSLSQKAVDAYLNKNYDQAQSLWKSVLAAEPDNTMAQDYLERIRSRRGDGTYSSVYKPSSDPSSPEKAAKPASPEEVLSRSASFASQERYPEAIEILERYAARNPSDSRASQALSDLKSKQKDIADKRYKESLQAYTMGDINVAMEHWRYILKVYPEYQKARQALIKVMADTRKKS